MAAFILSERILAKSFVAMTFLLIGAMLLYVAQESAETLKPIAIIVLDPNFKESPFASTGNVISTKSKESQTTSAESQPERQNSNVPSPGHDKSTVPNSGNIRRLNGPNASAAKNNTQIDMNAKNSTAAIVKYAKPSQSNSQQSNSHMIQPTNRQNVSQAQNKSATQLPLCKKPNEDLVGRLQVNQSVPDMENIASSWNERNWVLNGGAWRPITCQAVSKVAIIIPYRDRYPHLKIFLRHIHPILKRQLLDYRIIVVEQNGDTPFNRAMLFNIGYKEALRFHDFQCFVFHDVDLLPEDDRNYYGCPLKPRHLSVAVDKFQYKLPYSTIFGGVGSFTKEQFEKINGFSNKFWGWGGEDDDLYKRIRAANYTLSRPMIALGRYTMLKVGHKSAAGDRTRHEKLRTSAQRMATDGLNSLKYDVVKTDEYQLYTQVTVNVDPDAV